MFEGGNHPDFFEVEMEKDRHEFRIDVVRNLLPKLALKPALGSQRVTIIDDADRFNDEAANARCLRRSRSLRPIRECY